MLLRMFVTYPGYDYHNKRDYHHNHLYTSTATSYFSSTSAPTIPQSAFTKQQSEKIFRIIVQLGDYLKLN